MPLILSNLPSLFLFNITMIVLAHITKYSNIFVRNLRIFEYIRTLTFQWSEYSNIFVFQFSYIRIRISNIRPKIFEYSNIFEYSLRSGVFQEFVKSVLWKFQGCFKEVSKVFPEVSRVF